METNAWIITEDHIDKAPEIIKAPCIISGPRIATEDEIRRLVAGEGHPFRMFDDDGILYYIGRYLGDPQEEEAFAPLEDFGTPGAGCTEIQYRNPSSGRWETL